MNNQFNNLPDDDFIIGQGFELQEVDLPEKPQKSPKKKKGKNTIKSIAWVVMIFVVAIALAFTIIYVGADYMGIGFGRGEEVTIEVPQGTPTAKIAEILQDSGAVKVPFAFRVYAKLKKVDNQFKYGVYNFSTEAGYDSIAEMLITQGAKAQSVTVTIPEGTGINDYTKNVNGEKVVVPGIATLLEKAGVCTKDDFLNALDNIELEGELLSCTDPDRTYHTLEGYLFPETYDFYNYDSKECAKLAVKKMIAESEKRITDNMYKKAKDIGYNMNQILTMASIIQMEAGTDADALPKIAAVFYNRLNSKDFSTLGSSPTCFYGDSFKRDDGRYNTYTAKGLPPGPLCSPSIDAINAALNPDSNEYYYFVTDAKGKFYFHKTLQEQNQTINKLKQDKNWIYEYFNK
ncbi:MAG: endolytic transglycosylase MltG [Clostridia bacterium]|nr:endolytic transglycosylase MltG [Clostridia bacterium]